MIVNGYKIEPGAYLRNANLEGADLRDANLRNANLEGANLQDANLKDAYLEGVNLKYANLEGANLRYTNLRNANLEGADLLGANLQGANLRRANLQSANLKDADLKNAILEGTNIEDAKFSPFLVCPETGAFTAFKKVKIQTSEAQVVLEIEVQALAWRAGSFGNRKLRASSVRMIRAFGTKETSFVSMYDDKTIYKVGEITSCDSFNMDPRLECTDGLHFFMTRQEAEDW